MVSINTNLSSIIAQRSMTKSTNLLNQAIERMSTGYKINHAADNAANYSISQNINAQMSSYDIAADNISMGMDLVQTAQDTIAELQDRGSRLQAILTQARNGTYGAASLAALTNEAQALVEEINRLYVNTEYNGKHIFEGVELPDWAKSVKSQAGKGMDLNPAYNEDTIQSSDIPAYISQRSVSGNNGFIQEIEEETPEITLDKRVTRDDIADAIRDGYKKIGLGSEAALRALASYVNNGGNTKGITFILTSDITIARSGWAPIGVDDTLISSEKAFRGIFNGNGHTISGLGGSIGHITGTYGSGLFGYVYGGEIKNLGLIDCNIADSDSDYVGAIAGILNDSSVTNCYATRGSVNGNNMVGGLVGRAYSSDISYSYANIRVNGNESVGGLVGNAKDSDISYSYAKGSAEGKNNIGGLVGYAVQNTSIRDSASTCRVENSSSITDTRYTGSLIGLARGGNISLRDTYAIESEYEMIGEKSDDYTKLRSCITVLNRDTLQHSAGYKGFITGFVEETPEIICSSGGVYEAISNGYTKIGIADEFALEEFLMGAVGDYGSRLSGITFILTSDIDMGGRVFEPADKFYGILNGNGHTISGLVIDVPGNYNASVGLFSAVAEGGGIKNLGLVGCEIHGGNYNYGTGALAGELRSAFITNCYSSSDVAGGDDTGGLVGVAKYSDISYSYATGSVEGVAGVGGLVGHIYTSDITNCYATGDVEGEGNSIGGLVGSVYGNSAVSYSYATGNVEGDEMAGGLVGSIESSDITNCYATGRVDGYINVGGLAGTAEDSSLSYSYSTGSVEGISVVGGFVGTCHGDDQISYCYTTGDVLCTYNYAGGFGYILRTVDYSFAMNNISCAGDEYDEFAVEGRIDRNTTGAFKQDKISLQVGINGDSSSQIKVDTIFNYDLNIFDITSDKAFESLTEFLKQLNSKANELGAAQNRLESALESTTVSMDNLASSLSTIRDADMAKVSSQYIRQQILQQAAATLMSTANQSPAIALQLI